MRFKLFVAVLLGIATGCAYDRPAGPGETPVPIPNEGLWIASGSTPAILKLAPDRLHVSGNTNASVAVTTASATLLTVNSVAFDTAGTMWVASADDSRLIALSATALGAAGATVASRIITPAGESLSTPSAIAFDANQRLWVANAETGTLVRYDAGQLATSGAPEPALRIIGPTRPSALAFDASGGLWVANSRTNSIARYSPDQIATSGTVTPGIVLRPLGAAFIGATALAFDAAGTLWVAYPSGNFIAGFSREQLAVSNTSAPKVVLSAAPESFAVPVGLAFDADGALWIASGDGTLVRYAASSLRTSGAPAPSDALTISGHTALSGIAFWPRPPMLPLR
jgi:sugar lactone lactonase YvrE